MYLDSLKLWNWRKFSEGSNGECGLHVKFNSGLNILVGENDSGKTAIIDAIKTVLSTNNQDVNWIKEEDFYSDSKKIKIECIFKDLSPKEESFFYEWLTLLPEKTEFRVLLEAEIYSDINKINKVRKSIKAGPNDLETGIDDTVRQVLSVTYLKPLRDASIELKPGNKSRIAQVVKHLSGFSNNSPEQEKIVKSFSSAFSELKLVLDDPVLNKIGITIDQFFDENNKKTPEIKNKEMNFVEILKRLELNLGEIGTGLGSSNLLFMAVELLLLKESEVGPKVAIIEEVEAHIHPQAQLRVIKHFENNIKETGIQYIFSSHSPIIASSISLRSIIFIHNKKSFPMGEGNTKLLNEDYEFLERFLDATKANMFFAQGVIFVEGDAENLLLPAIAEVLDRPLHRYGVSIINLGNLSFKRYSSIFLRQNQSDPLNFPVSILTDLDLKPVDYYEDSSYIKIDETLNDKIASFYNADQKNSQVEKIYVQIENVIRKSDSAYKKYINAKGKELKEELKKINVMIHELLANVESNFEEYRQEVKKSKENKLFNNVENTKVFVSEPWTLEHCLALSEIRDEIEDIILDLNYEKPLSILKQKAEWNKIQNADHRATEVYNFMTDRSNISKAVVAQNLAKKLVDNKKIMKSRIESSPSLTHIVNAIYHVTGGE